MLLLFKPPPARPFPTEAAEKSTRPRRLFRPALCAALRPQLLVSVVARVEAHYRLPHQGADAALPGCSRVGKLLVDKEQRVGRVAVDRTSGRTGDGELRDFRVDAGVLVGSWVGERLDGKRCVDEVEVRIVAGEQVRVVLRGEREGVCERGERGEGRRQRLGNRAARVASWLDRPCTV